MALTVFAVALIASMLISGLAFDDLKKMSDRKTGRGDILEGFFFGLANMQLIEGETVNYEYSSDVSLLFVVRLYDGATPYEYEGIELVNETGASGSGEFSVPVAGFYVFQVLVAEQSVNANVDYDFYKDVPLALNRAYSEAGITVALFVVSVAILVAGRRWAAGGPQMRRPFLFFWRTCVTNWQNWSPAIVGLSVVMATMLIRLSSPETWSSNLLEWANWLGGNAAFWGLLFGLTYIPRGQRT